MLYKPVYLKGKAMAQAQIPMGPPKPPKHPEAPQPIPPMPPTTPPAQPGTSGVIIPDDEDDLHLPVLICKSNCMLVYPHEATRDVLTGKVAYYMADDNGVTKFTPKHVFCALKLERKQRDKYGEYPLVGAHERFLEKKEKKKTYRRRYISQEVGGRGIYEVSG